MSDKYPGGLVTAAAPAGYSVFFDGSGDFLSRAFTSTTDGMYPQGTTYTIEAWVYMTSTSGAQVVYSCSASNVGAFGSVALSTSSGVPVFECRPTTGGTNAFVTGGTVTANTWTHIAGVVSAGTARLYVNGVSVGTPTSFSAASFTPVGAAIGRFPNGYVTGITDFTGYISNLRITQSTAVYTAAFTPPTQLLNIANTSLLTCQSPTIIDNSSNNFTITTNGNAAVSTFTPFPSSYYFYNAPTDGNTRNMLPSNIAGFNPAYGAAAPGVWTLDQAQYFAANRLWPIYDPYFNYTTLMLSGNQPSGVTDTNNNVFKDSSANNFLITRNGNTTQGTFSPFSQTGWSMYCASLGSTLVGIYLNGESDFAFGTGDFTIEMFINMLPGGGNQVIYDSRPSLTQGLYPSIYLDNSVTKIKYYTNTGDRITQTSTFTYNVWHHVVVTRTGTNTKMFIDGVQEGSTYTDSNNYINSSNRPFTGNGAANDAGFFGYMSNFRVVKGSGPYQNAGSSITVPTAPLTPVANTVLLTLQSNRFVDTNTQVAAKVVNPFNNPSVQPFSPFAPTAAYSAATVGGSGYFDGTGDFVTAPTGQTPLLLGNSDFTIEAWVYRISGTGTANILAGQSDLNTAAGSSYLLYVSSSATSDVYVGSGAFSVTSPNPTVGQWAHVAMVRTSGTLSTYLNGSRVGTRSDLGTSSVNAGSTSFPPAVGAFANGVSALNGYISGLRLIKGSGGYNAANSTITIPTAPPTAITNTSLLLNFTNAGVIDATAKNIFDTAGNAAISTAQSRFGGSSMSFGGGGVLYSANQVNLQLGTGDYTVEFWINPNNFSGTPVVFDFRTVNGATGGAIQLSLASGVATVYGGSSTSTLLITAAAAISTGVWTHIALTRSGTSTRLFINGTQSGSTATDSTNYTLGALWIGSNASFGSNFFNGFIDDFRVTKGFARYTTSFVPPTSAMQLQ